MSLKSRPPNPKLIFCLHRISILLRTSGLQCCSTESEIQDGDDDDDDDAVDVDAVVAADCVVLLFCRFAILMYNSFV